MQFPEKVELPGRKLLIAYPSPCHIEESPNAIRLFFRTIGRSGLGSTQSILVLEAICAPYLPSLTKEQLKKKIKKFLDEGSDRFATWQGLSLLALERNRVGIQVVISKEENV